jgi:hypothetical protein
MGFHVNLFPITANQFMVKAGEIVILAGSTMQLMNKKSIGGLVIQPRITSSLEGIYRRTSYSAED